MSVITLAENIKKSKVKAGQVYQATKRPLRAGIFYVTKTFSGGCNIAEEDGKRAYHITRGFRAISAIGGYDTTADDFMLLIKRKEPV